jgi:hypothetical protein
MQAPFSTGPPGGGGILILLTAWAVPFVGWVFAQLALLGGLGAVTTGLGQYRRADTAGHAAT